MQNEQSYRRPAVIIIGTDYDPDPANDPSQIAELLKEDGIVILTITLQTSSQYTGVSNSKLGDLSSPGYAYENTDGTWIGKMLLVFTQINCFCPPKTYQFKIYNDEFKNFTVFADCLYSSGGASIEPQYAERDCAGAEAVLTAVTSEQKLKFIVENVVQKTMPNEKQFTVGAHVVDGQWMWFGYNGTTYPVGDYPIIPVNPVGTYGYFDHSLDFNWDFQTQNAKGNPKPYVCQSRACDADFLCKENPISPTTPNFNCEIDFTIAIDMSSAMQTTMNIKALVDDLLTNFFTSYGVYNAQTSLIVFGTKQIEFTGYFDNYDDVRDHLHLAEIQAIGYGLQKSYLSDVYLTFRDNELISGRNLKKIFVVMTAITNPDNVGSAVNLFDQIHSQGAYVILVSLNNPNNSGQLTRIADQVSFSSNYTVPDTDNVLNLACKFSGQTIGPPHPTTTLAPGVSSLSNAIGTPCSTNSSNAWLDLYFVIEVSKGMLRTDLGDLGGQLYLLLENLTIGQTPKQSTRVGIITYASTATVRLNLTACDNAGTLFHIVLDLQNYRLSNDSGTNIKSALETAYNLTQIERSYRRTIVIVIAASYDPYDPDDPNLVVELMKEDGTAILTIAFESSGALNPGLAKLSSPGYAYENTDLELFDKLLFAFTQINCFCPPKTYQLQIYNDAWRNFTVFADCLYSSGGASIDPQFAEQACASTGAVLASVTKERKLDFIVENVMYNSAKIKQFTVGAHLVNGQWVWYGYNNTVYPVGDYPKIPSGFSGIYGYFNNTFGFNWDFQTQNEKGNPKPYVCQLQACDADFFCNVTAHSFKKR
uniref:VWFA domain-containing protein n=1 Tax=Panagrolaimus sp. JU765 TaxID=591449 RepID=A0AC34Q335_9BILA